MTSNQDDITPDVLKHRLSKALKVARTLKSQSEVEKEVNRELARRNEESRIRSRILENVLGSSRGYINEIENELDEITKMATESEGKKWIFLMIGKYFYYINVLCDMYRGSPSNRSNSIGSK